MTCRRGGQSNTICTAGRRKACDTYVHQAFVLTDRKRCCREASPSAGILDSQSVHTADQKGAEKAITRAKKSPGASATPRPTPTADFAGGGSGLLGSSARRSWKIRRSMM